MDPEEYRYRSSLLQMYVSTLLLCMNASLHTFEGMEMTEVGVERMERKVRRMEALYRCLRDMIEKTASVYQGLFSEHFVNAFFQKTDDQGEEDIVDMVGLRILLQHMSQDSLTPVHENQDLLAR